MKINHFQTLTIALLIVSSTACNSNNSANVTGELQTWHAVTVTFEGPETREDAATNPFTDYRLTVTFTGPTGAFVVPGYYAADGNAGETGAEAGGKWRAHIMPDMAGDWTWSASFRTGPMIAIDPDPEAGKPAAFDGARGAFTIAPTDKSGRDFRGRGALRYVDGHYLQFAETGAYYLKGGADSPENFLAYTGFDGTWDRGSGNVGRPREAQAKGFLHSYEPHVADWREGDPTWRDGKGKGIIGALNYLASKGMNSVYFLTMNVEGDGDDVWPWVDPEDYTRFDCSKLDQWNIVFNHMTRTGIMLHVITQEQENDQLLDGGDLGPARRLYYRELIARFAHHPAIVWNLGEENTNTLEQRKAFSRYIHETDVYDHPVTLHTFPSKKDSVYTPLLTYAHIQGISLQNQPEENHAVVKKWRARSAEAGYPWVVFQDEQTPAHTGVMPDADDPNHDMIRDKFLWGSLLGGAAGVEWYFGYRYAHHDLLCEDWRSRDGMWDQTRYALEFMQTYLPFHEMDPADELTPREDDYVFAKPGAVYAVYVPSGGTVTLDLQRENSSFTVQWFNPRTGGALQQGSVAAISGPGTQSLGNAPADPDQDWVALVRVAQ